MHLELIIGPMFAGKSSTILQRVKRAEVIGIQYLIVTSESDTRYNENVNLVKTHDKQTGPALGLTDLKELTKFAAFQRASMIIIEEAQFFTGLYDMVKLILEVYKKNVIVVGLDGDSDRKPFGEILQLIPLADTITKITALCKRCCDGTPALFTCHMAKAKKNSQVCVGGEETYEALCRKHYLEHS
jgi:thymidine kinase